MSFVGGLLVGVLLGSLVGLLLAPSGTDTRRQIADRSETSRPDEAGAGTLGLPMTLIGALADRVSEARRAASQAASEERARLAAEWTRAKRGG
jgi:gas vesicle protein